MLSIRMLEPPEVSLCAEELGDPGASAPTIALLCCGPEEQVALRQAAGTLDVPLPLPVATALVLGHLVKLPLPLCPLCTPGRAVWL